YVIAALFDFAIASTVLAGLMVYYRIGLTLNALYAVPIILILTMFVTAVALFLSATQVRFRDIGVAMPLLLQLWMFASPVVYPLSAVPPRLRGLFYDCPQTRTRLQTLSHPPRIGSGRGAQPAHAQAAKSATALGGVLGRARREFRGRAWRGARHHRAQRGGQEHDPETALKH